MAGDVSEATLEGASLDDLDLLLGGAYAPLTGYLARDEADAVERSGRLADGTPWPLPLTLELPAEGAAEGSTLLLRDPEGAPVGRLTVTSVEPTTPGSVSVAGPVDAVASREAVTFGFLRRPATEVAAEVTGPVLAVPVDGPLSCAELEHLTATATELGAHVLLLPLVGADCVRDPDALVRMTLAAAAALPSTARVVAVPLPRRPALLDALLRVHVAAAYGATHVISAVSPAEGLPATVVAPGVPDGRYPDAVDAELRRSDPPRPAQGLTVFFTGLSGSGKSTLARALAGRLAERGDRTVSLLDGDVVRRSLSAGLGFSREDRDRNVTRIGWVAAEVTRHGGVAICAPIAPYASVRAEVRRMVERHGGFVLVHVATPIAECERRDRKGLYAQARAGIIPAFTGVSDPYEAPDDADLTIDTTDLTIAEATDRVLRLLVDAGWLQEN
jgi:sulfate adenylyltransferase